MMIRAVFLLIGCLGLLSAEEWSRFRGPNGSGVAVDGKYPAAISAKNQVWRTAVRPGVSSPVLTEKHIFLTGFETDQLYTQCLDRDTGRLLWEKAEQRPREQVANKRNHPAAVSAVTDGANVYVFFPELGMISYSADGKRRWKTALGPFANLMGLGASPIYAEGLIVLLADQDSGSYLGAFDAANGEIRWKVDRVEGESWGTPLVYRPKGGPARILTFSRGQIGQHALSNGARLHSGQGIPPTIVGSPVLDGENLYLFGYGNDAVGSFDKVLVRLDKNGDGKLTAEEYGTDDYLRGVAFNSGNHDGVVTREEYDDKQKRAIGLNALQSFSLAAENGQVATKERWRYEKSFSFVISSPLLYDGVLYVVRNGGILTSFDPKSGAVLKNGRVEGALGGFSASPVAADGKLYLVSEDGKLAILKAGANWEVLGVHDLDEASFATPALSNGQVYVRTAAALYRFGGK